MWRKLFLTVLALSSIISWGQGSHPLLESMSVRQVDDGVRVDFGVKGGASCTGVQLQRRSGSGDYVQVGQIQGVCGGSEFTEFYSILDTDPIANELSFYRLILGNQGPTGDLSITFIPFEEEVIVYPNPSSGLSVSLRWRGIDGDLFTLVVVDSNGRIWQEGSVVAPAASISVGQLPQGLYILRLTSKDGKVITSRLLRTG